MQNIDKDKMSITEKNITIRELTEGYINDDENGVRGYGGRLDIRPKYQREFIYTDKEQVAVIDTVLHGWPLNIMYWAKRTNDSEVPYEVMDGQQRTLSICQYVDNKFSYDWKYFNNQPEDIKEKILNYPLTVYICEGEPSEKLKWFQTINIAGKPLTQQELRNAVYAGPFTLDAKLHFSKTNCAASRLCHDIITDNPIRQELLERALKWMADHETRMGHPQTIEGYMAKHQNDPNANNLWSYFQNVINWAQTNFSVKQFKKIMRNLDWAYWYDTFKDETLDTKVISEKISKLLKDGEVQKKTGIIPYVLTGEEHYLDLRTFSDDIILSVYEKQQHKCAICGKEFDLAFMEADHILPWAKGGRTTEDNCQMLCRTCNRRKSDK